MTTKIFCITTLAALFSIASNAQWVTKEVAEQAISEFERLEIARSKERQKGQDRRVSSPFITGDGFRDLCSPHICEEENRCRLTPEDIKDGQCVFVKSDFFAYFANSIVDRIKGKYVVVSHNGDLSVPDGQTDAPQTQLSKYITSNIMQREYDSGRLLALHAQNLWWRNITSTARPAYAHCIPIGFENRKYDVGKNVHIYAEALRTHIVNKATRSVAEKSERPLLLIAFYPKGRSPDRAKVLRALGALPPKGQSKPLNPFYNETDLSHSEWLQAIGEHKFVLAPFGHGLDTHRVSEILLMGGIPVMRKSGIASCYDDSDNTIRGLSRGSLPVVILNSWAELTKEKLDSEWDRLSKVPNEAWDHKRLFLSHWLERIGTANLTSIKQ